MVVDLKKITSVAKSYYDYGLNVVPIELYKEKGEWKKRPLIRWVELQSKRQIEEEFKTLPWDKAKGFAIILGKAKNGKHLCVVDFDTKNVSEQAKKEGRRIFDELPYTYRESTINGGEHKFFLSSKPVKTNSTYHNVAALELLGENKLCITYPSYGYESLEKVKKLRTFDDANKFFEEMMQKQGFVVTDKWFDKRDLSKPYKGTDPACIGRLLGGVTQGIRNEVAIRLASYFANFKRLKYPKALERLLTWNEKNSPPLSRSEIERTLESAIQHEYRYGCEDSILKSVCQVPCPFQKNVEKKLFQAASDPLLFVNILKDLSVEVKRDLPSKCINLLTNLSAYLDDPLNTSLKGISGVGKSYNSVQAAKYFPKEDIMFLGGLSPKAFVHQHGILMDEDNKPIVFEELEKPMRDQFPSGKKGAPEWKEAKKEYQKKLHTQRERLANAHKVISLSNKILVFLESPSEETFRVLYPILSHDTKRIEFRYVDDMETKLAVIEGFPSAIFLSTGKKYMEELSTRTLTITPEGEANKIKDANILTNVKASQPWEYEKERDSTRAIKEIILQVRRKLVEENYGVVIPYRHLYEDFSSEIVRDMRDFKHFLRLVRALTALHVFQRPILKKNERFYILSSVDDVITIMQIFAQIYETTRTGIEATILKFYNETMLEKDTWYLRELTYEYNNSHKRKFSSDTMGFWMRKLAIVGYVNIDKDTKDKRKRVYEPLKKEKVENVRKSENRTIVEMKLQKDFTAWIKDVRLENTFFKQKGFSTVETIDADNVTNRINESFSSKNEFFSRTFFSEPLELKKEDKAKDVRDEENRTFSTLSVKCPTCGLDLKDPEIVGPYSICSICLDDYIHRGYNRELLMEEIERMIKTRKKTQFDTTIGQRTLPEVSEKNTVKQEYPVSKDYKRAPNDPERKDITEFLRKKMECKEE